MKRKNNKGYIGIDLTISILVIVILAPFIITLTYNINKTNSSIKRKTQALSIASNAIEGAKEMYSEYESLSKLEEMTAEKIYALIAIQLRNLYGDDNVKIGSNIVVKIDDVLYSIDVQFQNDEETKLKVLVTYHLGAEPEYVELNTDFIIKNE